MFGRYGNDQVLSRCPYKYSRPREQLGLVNGFPLRKMVSTISFLEKAGGECGKMQRVAISLR